MRQAHLKTGPMDEKEYQMNQQVLLGQLAKLRERYPHEYVAFVEGQVLGHNKDINVLVRVLDEKEIDYSKRFFAHTDIDYEGLGAIL